MNEDGLKIAWRWLPITAAPVSAQLCQCSRTQACAARTRRSQGVISSKKLVSSMDLVAQ